jgi:hypothetical protein
LLSASLALLPLLHPARLTLAFLRHALLAALNAAAGTAISLSLAALAWLLRQRAAGLLHLRAATGLLHLGTPAAPCLSIGGRRCQQRGGRQTSNPADVHEALLLQMVG